MKKILSLLMIAFMFTACAKNADTIVGKEYKLDNAENNAEITIGFAEKDSRYFGKAAVNRYFGSYKIEEGKLMLSPAATTMMMGPQKLMRAEQNYLKALGKVKSYKLEGKTLTIEPEEGAPLVFTETGIVTDPKY